MAFIFVFLVKRLIIWKIKHEFRKRLYVKIMKQCNII